MRGLTITLPSGELAAHFRNDLGERFFVEYERQFHSVTRDIPVEVAESEFPIRIERYGLVPDSGGAGRHRGGLAVERAWRCLTPDTSLIVRSDRAAHAPYGLQGGMPGALSSNVLHSNGSARQEDTRGSIMWRSDDRHPGC